VRIRDESDVGINVEFPRPLLFRESDETYALDTVNDLTRSGVNHHWLYVD
jgi:hypothetical protein